MLGELARRVEADIPVVGAAKYLYALFRRRGFTYLRGTQRPCPICGYETIDGYCPMYGHYGD